MNIYAIIKFICACICLAFTIHQKCRDSEDMSDVARADSTPSCYTLPHIKQYMVAKYSSKLEKGSVQGYQHTVYTINDLVQGVHSPLRGNQKSVISIPS